MRAVGGAGIAIPGEAMQGLRPAEGQRTHRPRAVVR